MSTNIYTGNSIAVNKQLVVQFPSSLAVIQPTAKVQIGCGKRLLAFTGWDSVAIQAAWATIVDSVLNDITCTVSGTPNTRSPLAFTCNNLGQDFELTILVDGQPLLVTTEVQKLHIFNAPTGTFTLTFQNTVTGNITYNHASLTTTATNITNALNALAGTICNAGDVTVVGSIGPSGEDLFTFTFEGGQYFGLSVPAMTVDGTLLTGGTSTVIQTIVQAGQAGQDCIQTIKFTSDVTGGQFTLTISPVGGLVYVIPNLAYNITAGNLQTAIIAVMGASAVAASGGALPGTAISLHFGGSFVKTLIPLMGVDMSFTTSLCSANTVIARNANIPTHTDNTWDLAIIPGEGTLGVNYDNSIVGNIMFLNISVPATQLSGAVNEQQQLVWANGGNALTPGTNEQQYIGWTNGGHALNTVTYERQKFTFTPNIDNSGTFTLSFNGEITGAITYNNVNGAAIQAASALSQLPGVVALTGGDPNALSVYSSGVVSGNGVFYIDFQAPFNAGGPLVGDQPMIAVASNTTGMAIAVTENIKGTGGTFTLTWGGHTTNPIPSNSTGGYILTQLQSLPSIGAGNMTVNHSADTFDSVENDYLLFTFTGALGDAPQALMVLDGTLLSPAATTDVTELTLGVSSYFTVTFGGHTTAAIPYNATASTVQNALEALSSIGAGNVQVIFSNGTTFDSTSSPRGFKLNFVGALAATNVAQITATATHLTPTTTLTPSTLTGGAAGTSTGVAAPLVNDETVHPVEIRFAGINPKRIEDTINEAVGFDAVRVTRIVHSLDHARIPVNAYAGPVQVITTWYYRDIYRLTFINDFANPTSISNITITFPGTGEPTVVAASAFMVVPSQTTIADDEFVGVSSPIDDLTLENYRVSLAFLTADELSNPLHLFRIERANVTSAQQLTYRYNLFTQYDVEGGDTQRAGIAELMTDAKIKFQWCSYIWNNEGTGIDTKTFTVLAETPLLNWDSSIEAIRYALERLIYSVSESNPVFFNKGNVVVSGSLFNSWMYDPNWGAYQAEADANTDPRFIHYTGDFGNIYHDLRVTLTGVLLGLPLNEYDYWLNMVVVSPYGWAANEPVTGSRFKNVESWVDLIEKPLPSLRNQRQRVSVSVPHSVTTVKISLGATHTVINTTDKPDAVETALNLALGSFPALNNSTLISLVADTPVAQTSHWMPEQFRKAVTVNGTTLATDPMEIEFTGYGYQYTTQALILASFNTSQLPGILTQVITQVGITLQLEKVSLTSTNNPTGGTFKLTSTTQTSALNWNATAAEIQAALVALGSIGAHVTCTGGPIQAYPVLCTFDSTLTGIVITTTSLALNNAVASVDITAFGGLTGTLGIFETIKGGGPSYFDNPANWSLGVCPSSGDTVVFDTCTYPVLYGLSQYQAFIVVDLVGTLLFTNRRVMFQNGQKVWVSSDTTLPTGLTAGYYYIINAGPDGTFGLSTTFNGILVVPTTKGVGVHSCYLKEVTVNVLGRYPGGQIGLPRIRADIGATEYLAQYLKLGMTALNVGVGGGTGLNIGRFDTVNISTPAIVTTTDQSKVINTPAILILFNNTGSSYEQMGGDVGISFYADEVSLLHSILCHAGTLKVNDATISGTVTGPQSSVLLSNTTVVGLINLTN